MKTKLKTHSATLPELEKMALKSLDHECFSDVDKQEIKEDFIAEPYKFIFAYDENSNPVGRVALYKRKVPFEDIIIKLGGIGGVCVSEKNRRMGIATQLVKKGLEILKEEGCDIACLTVDLEKKIYSLYEKLGFVMMEREISFENVHGEIVREPGTMFAPVCSQEIYEQVMNSTTTFHYGRGYW